MIDILKKIFMLLFVALITGVSFSFLIAPAFVMYCIIKLYRTLASDYIAIGILIGYIIGILVGSAWFLIKEFQKN